ncbi:MAG: metal ABC transporter permease [Sporocytophaga sp.]|uniref:metal ABC transporter permease n=1 Tax=Sporocytophaga sp. TaxID=2231183 RepID=UPI001B0EDE21|nr:iron chelate uptake ABC transporter family permease subunit [Sporocytophaga sp.]MBO9703198.1 metal ABC transporter permease [Sporocytophaga sp.]
MKFFEFFSFTDPNIRYVVVGSILMTVCSAVVGCFTFLRKRALIGDAVAHSVLPGVCLSFLLTGEKNPFILLIGAFITGGLSIFLVEYITTKTKLKEDSAIGIVLSVFFGIGILLLTAIQHGGNANQSGLDSFLFGKAASILPEDLYSFGLVGIILLIGVFFFFKEFTLISFDRNFAEAIGLPVKILEFMLTSITVLAVVTGIQAVGVVLMAAMLITPAAAARYWTHNLTIMMLVAAMMGAVSGIFGAYISYLAPSMPTGPWIVMVISMIAIVSFAFAPVKGVFARLRKQIKNQKQITDENILKLFFQLGEKDQDFFTARSITSLLERRSMRKDLLKNGLARLTDQGFLSKTKDHWKFTEAGKVKGQRVARLHRLWELYLTQYLQLAPDHVHDDAETIEHIITPELEAKILEQLKYPEVDPHDTKIPYKDF